MSESTIPSGKNDAAPCLNIDREEGIFRVEINNPARRNALTLDMWRELAVQVERAGDDSATRALVVCGAGDLAFGSGADITEFKTRRATTGQVRDYDKAVNQAQQALSQCPKPTVALIRGICMGGAMGIAAACDLRYANDGARFRMPAGLMGLGYSLGGIERMVEIMGAARTSDIFMTARHFDGAEAARIGFVHEVFPDSDFHAQTQVRLNALTDNAPLTLRAAKLALRHLSGAADAPDRRRVEQALQACFDSQDYTEGQRAFSEKRRPVFRGR